MAKLFLIFTLFIVVSVNSIAQDRTKVQQNGVSSGYAADYNPDLNPIKNLITDNSPTSVARGVNNTGAATSTFVRWTLNTPSNLTTINPALNRASFCGGLGPDGIYYAVDNGPPLNLIRIDTATGVATVIAPVTGTFGTEGWTELAYDKTTSTWYGSTGAATSSSLYTVNVTTGVATRIGAINAGLVITIAFHPVTNVLYGVDIVTDNLITINKTTAAGTNIGPMGFNGNFGAGSAFDELGVLYFACIDAGAGNARNFYTMNLTTGLATLVGSFPITAQISSFGLVLAPNLALNSFNLLTPPPGARIVTVAGSTTPVVITWDTSASGASYKFIFGNPTVPPRRITISSGTNRINTTLGALDAILAANGFTNNNSASDSAVGQWDIWAFKGQGAPGPDSLKSANGPRSLTLRRNAAQLTAFNLLTPPSGLTLTTSPFNTSTTNFNWTRSGQGVTYKWKFGSPTITNIRLSLPSNNSGFDTVLTITNNVLDGMLQGIGLNPGDSLVGQWAVWAYSSTDSVKSTQNFALTLKRQSRGDVIVVYDSTLTLARVSRDSVINNLSSLGATFDLFNRGSNTATLAISFRGYSKVIVLGEGTSVMSNRLKDSLKSYLAAGTTTTKSKLIIMSEDVGYHLDRTGSTFIDTAFSRSTLGFQYIADRPTIPLTSAFGLIGVTINPNAADSSTGPWPEVLRKSASVPQNQLHNLYRFRFNVDTINSIGRITPTYNVASIGVDVESLRPTSDSPPGSPVRRFVKGSMDYVDGLLTSLTNNSAILPTVYSLSQNYPNPFNPTTKIDFSIPKQGKVTLKIYDVLGKEVMTLLNDVKPAGFYNINFDASNFSSGVYFYTIVVGDFVATRKMFLLK